MQRTIGRTAASMLLVALVVSACSAGGAGGVAGTEGMEGTGATGSAGAAGSSQPDVAGDKAGGRAATVLTLGTNDTPGDASADYIEQFAADLKRISAGLVTIDIKYRAAGENVPRYDQQVAELVLAGGLDMGLVPTRAFDELGVTSLRALQAPFLLTDDDAMDAVVSSAISDDLMSGLPSEGFEGLALWPEALRHPYGFDAPILTLSDFDDLSIRTPVSRVSFELMTALGAVPHDLADARRDDDAAESGVRTIANINRPGVVTGNVTFFPKIQMLVAGSAAFARLTDEQRRMVRDAAAVTSEWVREHREHEDTAVTRHCRGGGILVLAKPSDVAEIVAASAPVYADLEEDPLTKRLIGEIRGIVEAPRVRPAYASKACGSLATATATATVGPSASLEPADDPSVLNGTYRADISEAYLESKGINPTEAFFNGGIFTMTFKDGVFIHHLDRDDSTCTGTYAVRGSRLTVGCRFPNGDTHDPLFSANWSLTGGELHFTDVERRNDLLAQAMWAGKPFVRIGDAP